MDVRTRTIQIERHGQKNAMVEKNGKTHRQKSRWEKHVERHINGKIDRKIKWQKNIQKGTEVEKTQVQKDTEIEKVDRNTQKDESCRDRKRKTEIMRERDDDDYIGNENRQVRYASGAVVYYFSDDFVLAS